MFGKETEKEKLEPDDKLISSDACFQWQLTLVNLVFQTFLIPINLAILISKLVYWEGSIQICSPFHTWLELGFRIKPSNSRQLKCLLKLTDESSWLILLYFWVGWPQIQNILTWTIKKSTFVWLEKSRDGKDMLAPGN